MKQLKGFVCGIIFAVGMMAIPAIADTVTETIDVLVNYVTVQVDGQTKDVRNFVHEGTTYIALRDVSEVLGYDVGWDDATRTASIITGKTPVQTPETDETALEVNGTKISESEYKEMYTAIDSYYGDKMTAAEKKETTEYELITQAIVDGKIDEYKVGDKVAAKEQVESELATMDATYGEALVDQMLAYSGFDRTSYVEYYVKTVSNQALLQYLSENMPEYAAVKDGAEAYYNENKENYKEHSVQVKHILIPTKDDTGAELTGEALAEAEATANMIASQLNTDNYDMVLLTYNNDPGMPDEGYRVTADSNFVQEFKDAALAFSEAGQVSAPVKSSYGYHILLATAINEYVPYDDFLSDYLNEKYTELDNQYIKQWTDAATIVRNDAVINAIVNP